jgi:hypothetical protein
MIGGLDLAALAAIDLARHYHVPGMGFNVMD